jgi:RNA polymerase sigma-70 factor (ECF subfamily)
VKEGKILPLRRPPDPAPSVSDQTLLAACAGGDLAALGTLFDRHHRALYSFLSRLAGADQRDLDDLVQATFLEVGRAARKYRGHASARTWLFGIAAHMLSHHVRADARRRALHARAAEATDQDADAAAQAERRDLVTRVGAALAELPHDLRVTFVMCVLEEIPGTEAAESLGIREGTLWWRLHEARKQLRAALERTRQ